MRHPVAAALAAAALALPLLAGVPFAIAEEAAASVASSASAADLSQESGSAASQPAESSASAQPQDAGESGEGGPAARAPFALASARVWVPYGVNVQDWLNSRDAGLYVDANGAELSAASVRDSFFGGRGPLVLDVSGGYPAQGSSLRAYLSWASNTTAKGDVPPDLGTIDVVMKTVNGADDLPLAPESIAGALKAATPNGTLGVTTVASGSGTGRTLRLWLGSDAAAALNEGSKVTISASDPNSTITFSRDYALDADGSFAASTAESSSSAGHAALDLVASSASGTYFAKLPSDMDPWTGAPASEALVAGQVVRLPVSVDAQAPSLSLVGVADASGSLVDLSKATVSDGILAVPGGRVTLVYDVTDPTTGAYEASGVDGASVKVSFGDKTVRGTDEGNGRYAFSLDLADLGIADGADLDLGSLEVSAADVAGNVGTSVPGDDDALLRAGVKSLRRSDTVFTIAGGRVSVPYGVDVASWLNARLTYVDAFGIERSSAEISSMYFGGQGPLVSTGAAYPTTSEQVSASVSFASLAVPGRVPALDGLDVVLEPGAASLPLAPDALARTLRVARSDGSDATHLAGSSSTGDTRLWISGDDAKAGATLTADGLLVQGSTQLTADGELAQGAQSLSVTGPATAYLKLAQDTDGLAAGQIVRVPVMVDSATPSVTVEVLDADGKPLTEDDAFISDGVLMADERGVILRASAADADSGLDGSSARLAVTHDGTTVSLAPISSDGGVYEYRLDAGALGTGAVCLSDIAFSVRDVAGNEGVAAASRASFPNGQEVTSVQVINKASASKAASFAQLNGTSLEAGKVTYTNSSDPKLSFGISDPLFSAIRNGWLYNRLSKNQYVLTAPDGTSAASSLPSAGFALVSGDTYLSDVTQSLAGQGAYGVHVDYQTIFLVERDFDATVLVDRTNPEVASVAGPEYDAGRDLSTSDGATTLVGGRRDISVQVADPAPAASPNIDTAGVDHVHVKLSRRTTPDGPVEELAARDLVPDKDGRVTVSLGDDGLYDLADIRLTVYDRAGNASVEQSLAEWLGARGQKWDYSRVLVDTNESYQAGVELVPATGQGTSSAYDGSVRALLWVAKDPWLPLWAHAGSFKLGVDAERTTYSMTDHAAATAQVDKATFNESAGRWEIPLELSSAENGLALDGRYELSFAYRQATPARSGFVVDTTAPQITGASFDAASYDVDRDVASMPDGSRVLVGGRRTIRVRLQDLQPRPAAEGVPSVASRDEVDTAGIDVAKATATLERRDAPDDETPESVVVPVAFAADADGESGWATISLDQDGLYSIADIRLSVPDIVGNGSDSTLELGEYARGWGFTDILVDSGAGKSSSLSVSDSADTPAADDPYYHRGSVDVTLSVTDRWLPIYACIAAREDGFFSAVLARPDESAQAIADVVPSDLSDPDGDGVWTYAYALPVDSGDQSGRPVEGAYSLRLDYASVCGGDAATLSQTADFGIDYTGPSFGSIELSETNPAQWGWIFARSAEDVSVSVSDNFSGMAADKTRLDYVGNLENAPGLTWVSGVHRDGVASFSIEGDGDRMDLAASGVYVKDAAGNETTLDSFLGHDSNIPAGATAVSVDLLAPQMTVSYDNNDVRNGRYYNAARTATVTFTDSNLDLLVANDPDRVLVTKAVDGSETQVKAKDLRRSDDNPDVWSVQVPFDSDGDCTLDASVTDPAWREATPVHDEFTVDTTKPLLMVSFDNNESANGMYFKAPRTATAEVVERNFDASLATVTTTAADASGSSVAAPGQSSWASTAQQYGWQASVYFGEELHYTLTAQVSDLAGNAADVIEVPEFVIDMTAPSVTINNVADQTAYAGQIAPTVSFSDTNFNPAMATYELAGANRGDVTYEMLPSVTDASTSRDVSYPDFAHEVDDDDIYTLRAEVTDLAGNASTTQVTFSVNRFGSNYQFIDGTDQMLGAYLAAPRDVRIREVNVSGLDTSASHAEVVHGTRVESLAAGTDYQLETGQEQSGWSETTYTLPSSLFAEDGYYRVLLTSHDLAGNLSQNSMPAKNEARDGSADFGFAVDQTSPTGQVVGISSRGVYLAPGRDVTIDAGDGLAVSEATLEVDGQQVASWDADELAAATPTYHLGADGVPHTLRLTVRDLAGNSATSTYDSVVVASDLLAFIRNTPQLLFGTVAGIIGLLGAIAIACVLVIRHRRATAARRNPFGRTSAR